MEKLVACLMFPVIKQNIEFFWLPLSKFIETWFALILLFSVFVKLKHH